MTLPDENPEKASGILTGISNASDETAVAQPGGRTERAEGGKDVTLTGDISSSRFMLLAGICGPTVEVYLKSDPEKKYTLPKELLCGRSKFFDACFNGNFEEGKTQMVHLDEEIMAEPFEMLLQWLYTGKFPSLICKVPLFKRDNKGQALEDILANPNKVQLFTNKLNILHTNLSKALDILLISDSLLFTPSPSQTFAEMFRTSFESRVIYTICFAVRKEDKEDFKAFAGPLLPSHIERGWTLPRSDPFRKLFVQVATQQYFIIRGIRKSRVPGPMEYPYDEQMTTMGEFTKDILEETSRVMEHSLEVRDNSASKFKAGQIQGPFFILPPFDKA